MKSKVSADDVGHGKAGKEMGHRRLLPLLDRLWTSVQYQAVKTPHASDAHAAYPCLLESPAGVSPSTALIGPDIPWNNFALQQYLPRTSISLLIR